MQLKKIKRAEKKGTESVMDEKFTLLFYTSVIVNDYRIRVNNSFIILISFYFPFVLYYVYNNEIILVECLGLDVIFASCSYSPWKSGTTIMGYYYMGQCIL